jgi:hypothetical protein
MISSFYLRMISGPEFVSTVRVRSDLLVLTNVVLPLQQAPPVLGAEAFGHQVDRLDLGVV